MKTLATLTRHIVTYLIGMLVAWLAIYLTGADLESATKAANALIEPLVILAGFVAVIVSRLAMPFFDKIFRRGAGEAAGSGTPLLVALGVGTAAVGFLPSCSLPAGFAKEYPVTAFASYTDPQTGGQVGVQVGQPLNAKKAKKPKVTATK